MNKAKHDSGMNNKSQIKRFIETAKELGADDDEATFKAKLGQIAKAKSGSNESRRQDGQGRTVRRGRS